MVVEAVVAVAAAVEPPPAPDLLAPLQLLRDTPKRIKQSRQSTVPLSCSILPFVCRICNDYNCIQVRGVKIR